MVGFYLHGGFEIETRALPLDQSHDPSSEGFPSLGSVCGEFLPGNGKVM